MRKPHLRARARPTAMVERPAPGPGMGHNRGPALASTDPAPYTTTSDKGRYSAARWKTTGIGPNAAVEYGAPRLREQSRDLLRKNPTAGAMADKVVANIVGSGVKPKFADKATRLVWNKWVKQSAADGRFDFYGQQALAVSGVFSGGEVFVRLRTRLPKDGLAVPLQLQILEAEFVPLEWNRVLDNGNLVRQGIEFDKGVADRRVAYWVYPRHPSDSHPKGGINQPIRVPASEMLHVYWQTRPGQLRGEPWLTRALQRLKEVDDYDTAETIRKKITTLLVGFVRKTVPQGDASLEELQEIWGSGEDGAKEGEDGLGEVSLEPGTLQFLAPGEDITFNEPSDVGGQYETWHRVQGRFIASAVGLLYEQVSGDYSSVNDRQWRAAVNEFRRRCEMWQHHMLVFQLCHPVLERWVLLGTLAGTVARGVVDPSETPWTPPAWPYVNPVQDIQAIREECRAGLNSRTRANEERGQDVEDIDAEQERDNVRADKLGIIYDSDGRQTVGKGEIPEPAAPGSPPPP